MRLLVDAGGTVRGEMTPNELNLLMGALRETMSEIEDWEFSIRLGAEKEDCRQLFDELAEAWAALPAELKRLE